MEMLVTKATPISLDKAFSSIQFLGDRKPTSTALDLANSFSQLADYRDGAIFAVHYAGSSEWERHASGDELVLVVEGETIIYLLIAGEEEVHRLGANEFIGFETPTGVKAFFVTPQPTDHQVERPE